MHQRSALVRKSLVTAALAATFLTTAAFAASAATDSGTIKSLDAVKHLVTLADGKVFEAPAGWSFTTYKIGDKVKVTYQLQGGKMMASEIIKES
jgi:hypothetical protein